MQKIQNTRLLVKGTLLSSLLIPCAPIWATVKTDLDTLNNNVVAARDALTTGTSALNTVTAGIKTLTGDPTHNPTETDSIKGYITDLKNDIDSGQASITAALGTVGGVLDVDPTTGAVDNLKTQADAIEAFTDNSTGLQTMMDTTGVSTMTTELGYSGSGTIAARITAALAALEAVRGQTGSATLTGAHASLEAAIADLDSKVT